MRAPRPLPLTARIRYREEVARRIERGTYRMAMAATGAEIRNSIQDLLAIIADPKTEPDVREWKRADLRALQRALRDKGWIK